MKRYKLDNAVTVTEDMMCMSRTTKSVAHMNEASDGPWVSFADHAAIVADLERQIPEKRIARLEAALGLVEKGCCAECGRPTRDHKFPFGGFAPEAAECYRENGIDPFSGHKMTCSRAGKS